MKENKYGELLWFIPDGFIPGRSSGILESHEAICILNCNKEVAHTKITVYFEDRPPLKDFEVIIEGERTKHIRTDQLEKNGQKIPKGVPYAMKIECDVPIIVQYSRMDSTQSENALMTTIAYAGR